MNETLEIERYRDIEAELRVLASKAGTYGNLSFGLLGAAGGFAWLPGAEPQKVVWSFLCFGLLLGLKWIGLVVEANRAKMELSLHLAKDQVLAQGQILSRRID